MLVLVLVLVLVTVLVRVLVVKAVINHSGYLVEGVESLCVDRCTDSGVVVEAMYTGDGLGV